MLHRGFRSAKKNGVEVNEEQVIPFFVIIIGQEICDFFFYLDLRQLVNLPYLDRDLSFTTFWMILEKKGILRIRQMPQVQRLLNNSRRLQSDIIGRYLITKTTAKPKQNWTYNILEGWLLHAWAFSPHKRQTFHKSWECLYWSILLLWTQCKGCKEWVKSMNWHNLVGDNCMSLYIHEFVHLYQKSGAWRRFWVWRGDRLV